jgi:hypothetical protein
MSTNAFEALKHALTSAPVLQLPDFSKTFIVETDASGCGLGAVLMQDKHPIAYISKSLGPRQQALSVYERELLAIIYAVQKWGAYLSHAADALSRKEGAELLVSLLDSNIPSLMDQIKASWDSDATLTKIISELHVDPSTHSKFSWANRELRRKGKLVVGNNVELKQQIMHWMHNSAAGGHSGRDNTSARIKSLFFWKGLVEDVQQYIRNCKICQTCKPDLAASPGYFNHFQFHHSYGLTLAWILLKVYPHLQVNMSSLWLLIA